MRINHWTKPSRHKNSGKLGARAVVVPDDDHGWAARYEIDTHGMSADEVVAKLAQLETRHERWAQRLTTLGAVLGVEIVVENATYRLVDCTIPANSSTLIIGVREVVGSQERVVDGFPALIPFGPIENVPSNEAILDEVRRMLAASLEVTDAHEKFKAKVIEAKARGGGR